MPISAAGHKIELRDCELASAPINSEVGQEDLGAMRAAINCALANRQIITHLVRQAFADVLPQASLSLLYDVSHNTCKVEEHLADGRPTRLCRSAMTFVFSWRGVPMSSMRNGAIGTDMRSMIGWKGSGRFSARSRRSDMTAQHYSSL
jgi:tRNA-splicing ligase RtcB